MVEQWVFGAYTRYDLTTLLGLNDELLGAPESESTLKTGCRNELLGSPAELHLPHEWLTAVDGGGVWGGRWGVRLGTAMVAVRDQIVIS